MKKILSLFFVALFSMSMWATNEYNKQYLYVNATNCSWWTGYADAIPRINGYDDYDCKTWKYNMYSPTGSPETNVWYFDLSTSSYEYYLYTRGFELWRYSAANTAEDNYYKIGVVDGQAQNCLWRNESSVTWGYYAVPITSIALEGSGANIIDGEGTETKPYRVLVGNAITLTATPTFTPADNTMTLCANFGTSPAASPTEVQNSSTYTVSSTSTVELKCVGRNKYGDVYSADVTSSSVWVQGVDVESTVTITANDKTKGSITVGGAAFTWDETVTASILNTRTLVVTPIEGYYLTGWTLTNCTRIDGGAEDATEITIRGNGGGAAANVQANIEEDLRTPYTIKGGTGLTGNNWVTVYNMTKKSGHATEDVAYYTFSISETNTGADQVESYGFKVWKDATAYGLPADGNSYWWTRDISSAQNLSSSGKNVQIRADIAGNYEVKVDYSDAENPTVTVTFPAITPPTAIDEAVAGKKAVKRIVNGQLVIEREGKIYNALGAEVK